MASPLVNSHQQYLKTQIETASQPQLLLMLFDGAVKKVNIAKKAIRDKNIEKCHTELTKVQRIFIELMVALDLEKGGEMASNLLRIYDFLYHRLVQANIRHDESILDECLPIIENLREGWHEAVSKLNSEQKGQEAEPTVNTENHASTEALRFDSKNGNDKPTSKPAKNVYNMPKKEKQQGERPRLNIRG